MTRSTVWSRGMARLVLDPYWKDGDLAQEAVEDGTNTVNARGDTR